jgi:dTDP-4-dehydrorhamnose 3,5-epimerase
MQADLERMLNESVKDVQTVTPGGQETRALTHGVRFKEVPTHVDERGSVVELFDQRWDWHTDPFTYAYCFTLRPGYVKGWGLH